MSKRNSIRKRTLRRKIYRRKSKKYRGGDWLANYYARFPEQKAKDDFKTEVKEHLQTQNITIDDVIRKIKYEGENPYKTGPYIFKLIEYFNAPGDLLVKKTTNIDNMINNNNNDNNYIFMQKVD